MSLKGFVITRDYLHLEVKNSMKFSVKTTKQTLYEAGFFDVVDKKTENFHEIVYQ